MGFRAAGEGLVWYRHHEVHCQTELVIRSVFAQASGRHGVDTLNCVAIEHLFSLGNQGFASDGVSILGDVGCAVAVTTGAYLPEYLFSRAGAGWYGPGVAVGAGSISGSNVMPADSQIIMAAQEVEFMLIERGFRPAPLGSSGDFLVRFSIATVRRDPIAGWIADEASLQIYDAEDRELIAVIRTEANFVTPTVSSIVDSLMDEFDKVI